MTYDTAFLPSLVHRPASQLPSMGYPTAMSIIAAMITFHLTTLVQGYLMVASFVSAA